MAGTATLRASKQNAQTIIPNRRAGKEPVSHSATQVIRSPFAQALAGSCPPQHAAAAGGVSPDLLTLISESEAEYHRRDKIVDELNDRHRRAKAAAELESAAVPHHETVNSFVNVLNETYRLSTASRHSVAMVRSVLSDPNTNLAALDLDYRATLQELAEAADRRDSELAAIEERHHLKELFDQCWDASIHACDPLDAVAPYPARSLADVVTKLDFLDRHGLTDTGAEHIFSDIRRLAKAG